jgi:Xaa-Pro aminopeptidase
MTALERLQAGLKEHEVEALLLSNIDSVAWLTGFSGSFGWVLVTPERGCFLTDSRYTIQAQKQVTDLPVYSFGSPVTGIEFLGKHAGAMGIKKLWFEAESVTVAGLRRWQEKLPNIDWIAGEDVIGPLKLVKSQEEVEKISRACHLADACFAHACGLIQPGVTERQIDLEIEFFFKRHGADVSFPPIVVSGANSALPHGHASEKPLASGDFVTLDFGAKLDGYCSDLTRTVVVGNAIDRQREIYNQVLKAQLAAIEAMKPGVACKDIDALSRRILEEKDLSRYFGHGLGHGLGRLVHDGGALNAASVLVLAPGQVWTVEPGVYIPGFGGVRIEDDVVVTENGVEVLTSSPKELLELP